MTDTSTGFFSTVQSCLTSKFSGRLLSLILREYGKREPAGMADIISGAFNASFPQGALRRIRKGEAQFLVEHEFQKSPRRCADLAILLDGKPVLLVEVKEDDINSARNTAQISDYLRWMEKNTERYVIHLSRYFPAKFKRFQKDSVLSRVADVRYSNLHALSSARANEPHNVLSGMVQEYLEDIGVNSYQAIDLEKDAAALVFLGVQIGAFPHKHGFKRLKSRRNSQIAPQLLSTLLGNATALGGWLHSANVDLITQAPSARFIQSQRCDKRKAKSLIQQEDWDGTLSRDVIQATTLYVYADASLKKQGDDNRWCYAEIGYSINFDSSESNSPQIALYAQCYWPRGYAFKESDFLKEFPSEDVAVAELSKLLKKVKKKALRDDGAPKALGMLRIPG